MLFLGIDIGGNSANAVVADEHGEVIAFSKCGYLSAGIPMRGGRHEQHPKVWWIAAVNLTGKCLGQIRQRQLCGAIMQVWKAVLQLQRYCLAE